MLWYQQPVGAAINESLSANRTAPPLSLAGGTASPFINEALPIGNGRIGGLIAGGTAREQIVLNEDSLWTGDENPSGNDDTMGAYQCSATCSSICRDTKTPPVTGATSTSATRWRTSVTRRAA